LAFARGRARFAFFFAFGRVAFFFRFAAGRAGFRAPIFGSPIMGAGAGAGGCMGVDGIIGSIIPGPVQPLSEKSVCWSIGLLLRLVVGGRGL
jgi:hypothetical protein